MDIKTENEYPLTNKPGTPLWSENFALVFNDPVNKVSALFGVGTWYLDTSVWRENFAVTLPDGQVLVGRQFGRNTHDGVVSAAFLRYEIVEPEKKVRLAYDGPVWSYRIEELLRQGAIGGKAQRLQLTLDFDAIAPIWDMHAGHKSDKTGLAGAMHTEQLGRCNGVLKINDTEIQIRDAFGNRDHSRGARDIGNYRNHCWIQGSFPGGRCFQLYVIRMHHIEGIAMSNALVTQDGVQYPATVEQVEFVESSDDRRKPHTVVLKSALGEMTLRATSLYATIPVVTTSPFNLTMGIVKEPHALMFDEPMTVEWNGQTGYGWSERGFSKTTT